MSDKIVLITGASSGLGRAISICLASKNYHCILSSRNKVKLKEIADYMHSKNYTCTIIPSDLTSEKSIENLYQECQRIGFVEMVVNNAGVGIFSKIEDSSIADFDKQVSINLRAPFILSKKFIPDMKKKSKGRLIFINSVAGKTGYPFSSSYVSSKFGLRGLSESLREELRQDDIKVISIHPGAIDTPFWDNVNVDFSREQMLSPESVANDIVNAMESSGNSVVEEIVIRRNKGDF